MDDQLVICKRIKRARLIKEVTQNKVAEELNISIPTYSRFESGKTKLNINTLKKVCGILDLDFSTVLFSDENEPNTRKHSKKNSSLEKEINQLSKKVNSLVDLLEEQKKTNELLLKKLG